MMSQAEAFLRLVLKRLMFLSVHAPFALLTLATMLVLVACDAPCPPTPKQFPELHQAGLIRLPQFADLQRREGRRGFSGLTAVYRAVSDQNHVHIIVDGGTGYYDMRADGSELQRVTTKCQDHLSVEPGGHWGACKATNGILLHDMTGAEGEQVVYVPGSDIQRGAPYWSPDGHLLAFLTRVSGHCAAAVYRISFTSLAPTLVLAATLGLERFEIEGVDGPECDAFGPDWSPDGTEWLLNGPDVENVTIIKLEPLGLTPRQLQRSQAVLTPALHNNAIYGFGDISDAVWEDMSGLLAYESRDGWSIGQLDIKTGVQTTLLTQRVAGIGGLTWFPGEQRLAFLLVQDWVECMPPPAELYLLSL